MLGVLGEGVAVGADEVALELVAEDDEDVGSACVGRWVAHDRSLPNETFA